jgi:hypothetical protein
VKKGERSTLCIRSGWPLILTREGFEREKEPVPEIGLGIAGTDHHMTCIGTREYPLPASSPRSLGLSPDFGNFRYAE